MKIPLDELPKSTKVGHTESESFIVQQESLSNEPSNLDPSQWLEAFGDQLFRFALLRVSNTEIAEDLVQETLLGAIRSLNRFDGRSSLKTWLHAILRNKIRDHYAAHGREITRQSHERPFDDIQLGMLLHPNISNSDFANGLEREEFREALHKCQQQLPPHFGEAFRSRVANEEKPVREISEQLGVSETNFSVRLFRARLMLRKCLESIWLGIK